MTKITDRMLTFKPMIKTSMVTNHIFFAVVTFSWIITLAYISVFVIQDS